MTRAAAAWGLFLALAGCSRAAAPPVDADPDGPRHRAEQTEAELRKLGDGKLEVLSFHAEAERRLSFTDDFDYPTRLYSVPFRARVRFRSELPVAGRQQLMAQQGRPGWRPEQTRKAYELLLVLGQGDREPGDEIEVSAAGVFDDLEPGYRFRTLDRVR